MGFTTSEYISEVFTDFNFSGVLCSHKQKRKKKEKKEKEIYWINLHLLWQKFSFSLKWTQNSLRIGT